MRSFTVARAAVLPLFGLLVAACSVGDDEDLALGRENASGVEKGGDAQIPAPDKGKGISLEGDVEFIPVENGAGHASIEGKEIEQPLPEDLGKGEVTKEHPSIGKLPPKGDFGSMGDLPSKGNLPSKGIHMVNSACPKARVGEIVGACVQALTYAKNPETGECCVYATPCDVPKSWDASFSAEAVCR
ncbi:hypothetical protein [Polyangium sp. y55x31]|uniref:hypothetical protein n=1 Tax=Polyangium sp. y55x31 TaxID=3042688 RepID=UPI002482576A|nr:hypothetical protein [Polyangium sp. y55x31]MDI1481588.1 hypothetical protein [Polyangium sp. y55x31]